MTNTAKQPTCAERIHDAWKRRSDDLRAMLIPSTSDVELSDDGTLDTILRLDDVEMRYSQEFTADYRDEETGDLDLDAMLDDVFDELADEARERFYEFGLSFEYSESVNGEAGYWRFLMSWGGPSDELRFYTDQAGFVYRVEYWFLDWFDGDGIEVSGELIDAIWDALTGGETPQVPEGIGNW